MNPDSVPTPLNASRTVADLSARIAKAASDSETWRAAGQSELYLEAYSTLQALELELAQRLAQAGRDEEPRAASERDALMASLSIATDGHRFHYSTYRYDLLQDAVDYARLQQSRAGSGRTVETPVPVQVLGPDEEERGTMAELGITFQDGRYRLDEHRYDRLADAVAYARLRRTHNS